MYQNEDEFIKTIKKNKEINEIQKNKNLGKSINESDSIQLKHLFTG